MNWINEIFFDWLSKISFVFSFLEKKINRFYNILQPKMTEGKHTWWWRWSRREKVSHLEWEWEKLSRNKLLPETLVFEKRRTEKFRQQKAKKQSKWKIIISNEWMGNQSKYYLSTEKNYYYQRKKREREKIQQTNIDICNFIFILMMFPNFG